MYFYGPPSALAGLLLLGLLLYLLIAVRGAKEDRQARLEAKARRRDPQYWKECTQNQKAKNRELWKNMSKANRQLYYFGIGCFLLAFLIFAFIGVHAMLH